MVEKVEIAQKENTENKVDSVESEVEKLDKTKEFKKDINGDNKENVINETLKQNDNDSIELKKDADEDKDNTLNGNEDTNELKDVNLEEKAQRHLAEGNKAMLHGEATKAVDELAIATNLFSQLYGEMDIQTAPSLYQYGCALLEVGRMETGVLTNAFDGVIDKMEDKEEEMECDKENEGDDKDDEDDEKMTEEIIDAMCEKSKNEKDELCKENKENDPEVKNAPESTEGEEQTESKQIESKESEKNVESTEKEDNKNTENSESVKESQNGEESTKDGVDADEDDGDVEEEEDGEEKDGSESDDVGNLQLAWEVVDLARSIYQKKVEELSSTGGEELGLNNKKLVDCHLKLGEIGVESETYDRALVEFLRVESLLATDKSVLPHDRRFAEVNYQLGLTSSFLNLYDKAISYLQKSISVLDQRISYIESQMKDLSDNDAQKEVLQKELDEMKNLLPEINEKVKDINESRTYTDLKNLPQESSTSKSTDNKPADDISHLVRKKRKVDVLQPEDAQTKKTKVADTESKSETVA